MKIIECEQGTPEWFAVRCGIPSASNFDKIVTTKGEPSKQSQKYLYRLAGEKVSGSYEETYQNVAMARGIEMEAEARSLYQIIKDVNVEQVGFCVHDEGFGCSPDGFINDDGLLEVKCPLMATHVGYLIDGVLPAEYFQQVQGQLLVTDRLYVDFMSYYPGIKPFIIRVARDTQFIKALRIELNVFCDSLKKVISKLE